jgi:hypothetical protein
MRTLSLAAAITISLSSISTLAQEALIEFVDGEIASAEDVNSNFQHLNTRLNAIEQFGGCSVTQDGSSVVITCADGTSGVLASAGTVVVYPEGGLIGNSPTQTWPTGSIVLVDANDVILTQAKMTGLTTTFSFDGFIGSFHNDPQNRSSYPTGWGGGTKAYFLTSDCSGQAFVVNGQTSLVELDRELYVIDNSFSASEILFASERRSGHANFTNQSYTSTSPCTSGQSVIVAKPLVKYSPAQQIIDAAYPVRLEQLP